MNLLYALLLIVLLALTIIRFVLAIDVVVRIGGWSGIGVVTAICLLLGLVGWSLGGIAGLLGFGMAAALYVIVMFATVYHPELTGPAEQRSLKRVRKWGGIGLLIGVSIAVLVAGIKQGEDLSFGIMLMPFFVLAFTLFVCACAGNRQLAIVSGIIVPVGFGGGFLSKAIEDGKNERQQAEWKQQNDLAERQKYEKKLRELMESEKRGSLLDLFANMMGFSGDRVGFLRIEQHSGSSADLRRSASQGESISGAWEAPVIPGETARLRLVAGSDGSFTLKLTGSPADREEGGGRFTVDESRIRFSVDGTDISIRHTDLTP